MSYPAAPFWSRVAISGYDDCWEWTGARVHTKHGPTYGMVHRLGQHVAHRVAWILAYGEIPKGVKVLHKCDNPPCCNPGHLFLGTQQDNMIDRREKGRHRRYPQRDPNTGQWVRGKGVAA